MSTSNKVWFITGASRGFGLEIARDALARGDRVVATARKPEAITAALGTHDKLFPVALDVTDEAQRDAFGVDTVFPAAASSMDFGRWWPSAGSSPATSTTWLTAPRSPSTRSSSATGPRLASW